MSDKNEFEKTIIEASVLIITLLFIVAQMRDLPAVPTGDLFSVAFIFIFATIVATFVMLYGTGKENRFTLSFVWAGRFVATLLFMLGLCMVALSFYDLAQALGTKSNLQGATVVVFIVFVIFFLAFYYGRNRGKVENKTG